jgi:hypothetical protein
MVMTFIPLLHLGIILNIPTFSRSVVKRYVHVSGDEVILDSSGGGSYSVNFLWGVSEGESGDWRGAVTLR